MAGSLATAKNITLADGIDIFYREAGSPSKPTILLLHGFPSSSHQFRNLAPLLSETHHVLAPDLPGFGFTTVPESLNYSYTFANLTKTIMAFLTALTIHQYAVYAFDFGAPVAFRIGLEQPQAITAIVSQNGNAYLDGIGAFWDPIKAFWANDNAETRGVLTSAVITNFSTTKSRYEHGVTDPKLLAQIPPETYYLDQALLERPGQTDLQLSLFKDYENNFKLYPNFQEYFRSSKVPVLAIWGANDVSFLKAGAEAFARDVHDFKLVLLETGHFAIETHAKEIAGEMVEFLKKRDL